MAEAVVTNPEVSEAKVETKPQQVNGAVVDELVVKLRKPIQAHGEEIKELKFREPTASDIEACGSPVMIDFNSYDASGMPIPKMTYETKAMFAMMSRLAAVPPSTIRHMHPKDWGFAALLLAHRFFIPEI